MCLQSDNVVLIAQEDIVCYKVYVKSPTMNKGLWFSPFRQYSMPDFGETIKAPEIAIHSFANIEGTERLSIAFAAWILEMVKHVKYSLSIQVVKCVIPKNSEYLQGTDNLTKVSAYCSKELKFVESITILNKENFWEEIERLCKKS